MYDSRTDKARKARTRRPEAVQTIHRGARRPVDPKREAIEEGILAHLDEHESAKQVFECADSLDERDADLMFNLYAGDEPVAEWEWELLRAHPSDDETYAKYVDEFYALLEERVDAEDLHYGDPQDAPNEGLYGDDYDEGTDLTPWLRCVSVREAYDIFGEGFLIEGVAPAKREASRYYRVYELAREVGVNSRDLVWFLRVEGEYVRNHMSMVAEAVWIDVLSIALDLQTILGKRTTKPTPAQEWAEWKTCANRALGFNY